MTRLEVDVRNRSSRAEVRRGNAEDIAIPGGPTAAGVWRPRRRSAPLPKRTELTRPAKKAGRYAARQWESA